MRIKLPAYSSQKELFDYLRTHERELVEEKRASYIYGDNTGYGMLTAEKGIVTKAYEGDDELMPDSIVVDVIANLSCYYDSHGDVMLPDSWKKSISEKGKRIPFLSDHGWSIKNKIAKTLDVYALDVDLKKLGIKSDIKTAQALVFKGEFNPMYDECMYNKYKSGMVDQHSIGLQYVQIELGINDPEDKPHYKVWEKYFPIIINKSDATARGYFWAVKEAKIYENSAVLFGANEITPVLSTETANSLQENGAGKSTRGTEQPNIIVAERLKQIFNLKQ